MNPTNIVLLEFDSKLNGIGKNKNSVTGYPWLCKSAIPLWVANDETISLERFTLTGAESTDEYVYGGGHTQFCACSQAPAS